MSAVRQVQRPSPERIEEWLASAQAVDAPALGLDLSEFSALPRETAALLTNALLGTFGHADLRLRVGDASLDWLYASGLAFAVANRPGPTVIEDREGRTIDERWSQDWLPAD